MFERKKKWEWATRRTFECVKIGNLTISEILFVASGQRYKNIKRLICFYSDDITISQKIHHTIQSVIWIFIQSRFDVFLFGSFTKRLIKTRPLREHRFGRTPRRDCGWKIGARLRVRVRGRKTVRCLPGLEAKEAKTPLFCDDTAPTSAGQRRWVRPVWLTGARTSEPVARRLNPDFASGDRPSTPASIGVAVWE